MLYFEMEQFSLEYSELSHLSKDSENLNNQTKPKLVESLMISLTVLPLTDSHMKKQSYIFLRSIDELMKQTE